MNPAHFHLVLTHVPILGSVFGLCLFLLGLIRSSEELRRTSLWVLLLAGLSALPTYLTGRPAGALLTRLMPGMSMDAGDQHAEIAVVAFVSALVLAGGALLGLLFYRRGNPQPSWFNVLTLFLALVTVGLMVWTASLGGKIRHPEIEGTSAGQARN